MKRLPASLVAVALLVSPVPAQDWGSDFNMGTFAAGGGSDANGWLHFECADPDSGLGTAGRPHMSLRIKDGATLDKKSVADLSFWVGDDKSFLLPMQFERGSTDLLVYRYSPETAAEVLYLIEALREGERFAANLGNDNVAAITLDGSHAALEFVEGCIADAQ